MHFKTGATQMDIAPRAKEIRIIARIYLLVAESADVPYTQNLVALQSQPA
jgi:hypothetical protein